MTERGSEVFKIFIRGSIEDVWHEITKTDEAQQCFFNMCLHTTGLQPGAPMQMRSRNGKYVGAVGEVLVFEPPHRYAHTFRFTNLDDPPCRVTYELTEKDDGVEFLMRLDDLALGTKSAKQMKQGGPMIIKTLKAIVETGKPSLGTRAFYGIIGALEPLVTPKRCRVENWPLKK